MPATPTTSGRIKKPGVGESVNTWGGELNTDFDLFDDQIDGFVTVPLTGNTVLTSTNYASDQARNLILKFTGAGPWQVRIPAVRKRYIIWNACTQPVTITTGAGTTVTVDASDAVVVFTDGTDVLTLGYGGLSIKQYIAAQLLTAVSGFPGIVGNDGKWITNNGTSAFWSNILTTNIVDYAADQTNRDNTSKALAIAFAVAL